MEKRDFAPKVPFRRAFRNCESGFGTRVPLRSTVTSISQLRNSLRSCCENGKLLRNWRFVAKLKLTPGLPPFIFFAKPRRPLRSSSPLAAPAKDRYPKMARTRGQSLHPSNRKRSLRKEPSPGSVPEPAPKPSPSRPTFSSEAGATKAAGKAIFNKLTGSISGIFTKSFTGSSSAVTFPHQKQLQFHRRYHLRHPKKKLRSLKRQFQSPKLQLKHLWKNIQSEARACPILPAAEEISYGASASSKGFFLSPGSHGLLPDHDNQRSKKSNSDHFIIDGRHGILGARHIAEALQIPFEPTQFDNFKAWTNPTELEMVSTLSRGAANRSHLLRGELPPVMFLIDAFLRHNIYPLQHWTQRRGVLLEALYKMSEGFFFGPHHLIMAALLYFEEKVHKKKLQRADCIPLLFPRLLCQVLEHLGYPSEPQQERKRICPWAASASSKESLPKTYLKVYTCYSCHPSSSPAAPAPSQPSTSAEPRMAIPISEYRELCRALETLTASQSNLAQELAAIKACQEQMLASQAQQAAILRQLQVHFDLPQAVEPSTETPPEPHSQPSESHPPEPEAQLIHLLRRQILLPSTITPLIRHYIYLLFMFLCMFVLF
ncbi:hypothetical protein CK203_048045 [Vitis vinifera]|uniref:Uncharacterized protein n=1 Tax=Vitis vinifera TaxID=29760 RepID=A0A438GYV9_VITVI|nr:hypothetical protein CK203_048045 [Vitis vinifera]